MTFKQGDVVRVPFPYMDRATRQHRPALVISDGAPGDNVGLLWVVMITSSSNRSLTDDHEIDDLGKAGLPSPSIVRPGKVAVIEASHAELLGSITRAATAQVRCTMVRYLGLAAP